MATILFVDDEPKIIDGIKKLLSDEPYDVLGVTSPVEALDLLSRQDVHVLVADEKMPEMSGSELLAVVRERYPDIKRIVLTGHADLETAIKSINDVEIFRFLRKPVDEDELITALTDALGEVADEHEVPEELARLSTREREVLRQAVSGKGAKDIAKENNISPHTVRNHLKSIYRKLDVHSQRELMGKFLR